MLRDQLRNACFNAFNVLKFPVIFQSSSPGNFYGKPLSFVFRQHRHTVAHWAAAGSIDTNLSFFMALDNGDCSACNLSAARAKWSSSEERSGT